MGRHFKRAQLQQAQATGRTIRRIQFVDAELGAVSVAGHVDQQVAQQSVHQPGRALLARRRHLGEGNFQLIQGVIARFINARGLGCRADEQSGKQVGQRRVVMPVADQAAQQIRTPQKR
ncbi:hypothetical protein D3C76_1524310 [compost metagenome]